MALLDPENVFFFLQKIYEDALATGIEPGPPARRARILPLNSTTDFCHYVNV